MLIPLQYRVASPIHFVEQSSQMDCAHGSAGDEVEEAPGLEGQDAR